MRRTRTTLLARTIVVAALASAATVLALPGGGGAAAQDKPANTTEPRISGSAVVGATLSTTNGSWTGQPTAFAYQWVRCPQSGGRSDGSDCAAIGGATTSKYVVATADVDHRIRVRVSATNADGQQTVASNATPRVRQPDAGKPVNVAAPTLSGAPAQGETLRRRAGHVERPPTDHVHVPLAPLRRRGQQLRPPVGLQRRRVQPPRGRRRQDDPRPRHRPEQSGRGEPADGTERRRAGPAGAVRRDHAPERREVDPGGERARRTSGS